MRTLLCALLLLIAVPAAAADTPASPESIRALIALTRPQRMLEVAKAQMESSYNEGVKAGLGDTPLSPEQRKIIDEFKTKLLALLADELDWARFEPLMIDAYTATFSQREIDGILAFYRSEAGKAMIEKMPALTQTVMQRMQTRMRDLAPRLRQIQNDMMEKLRSSATTSGGEAQ